ncbi:ROK family protein [Ectobacillus funiculus]|uniref:ROK family protein n=1 Tax=Ectobacillus funiculus TaxID=137993 RepID=UPI00397DC645
MLKHFLQADLKKDKELKALYQLIHKKGPTTKVWLLEQTKMKQTTLTRMMDELLGKGLIRECGFGESSGGRPPTLYDVDAGNHFIIGIDITRIQTRVVLTDLRLQQIEKKSFAMTAEHTPERTVSEIRSIISGFMENYQFTLEELLGIGIGAVGPLDRNTGVILCPEAFYAPGWVHVPIVQQLQEAFPVQVLLRNGAHTAIIGESYQEPFAGENILYCISGEGLRCGVMTNGELLQNKTGDVSAYDHMIIEVNGRPCVCGKKGCITSYMSHKAIRQELSRLLNKRSITIEEMMKMIQQRHPAAVQAVMHSAYYYGVGIANMVNLLQPDVVMLSGALIYGYPEYYNAVIHAALQHMHDIERGHVTFTQGVLKSDAAAVGAAVLAFQSYF